MVRSLVNLVSYYKKSGNEQMEEKLEQIKKNIADADMILVGIGEEFEEQFKELEINPKYKNRIINSKKCNNCELSEQFIKSQYLSECYNEAIMKAYQTLENLILQKNYFIVSTCKDNYITHTNLKKDKMVFPCGNYQYLQCAKKCEDELFDASGYVEEIIAKLDRANVNIDLPVCRKCGAPMVFNNVYAENYNENGYIAQWEAYSKWLQGTLNRKLCILELGVGVSYPTVIRWPFEKIAFFNQKSNFYRVHSKLYQLSEELKNKGISIAENPITFLTKNLSY